MNTLLMLHIASGIMSVILAPLYVYKTKQGINFGWLRNIFITTIAGTITLGIGLIGAGAPLTRSCITLALYSVLMCGIVYVGDRKVAQQHIRND